MAAPAFLTPEQHQAILYGDFYDGLDRPLKPVLTVKIAHAMARRKALAVTDEPPIDYYQALSEQIPDDE
jgi:hypothetical protein